MAATIEHNQAGNHLQSPNGTALPPNHKLPNQDATQGNGDVEKPAEIPDMKASTNSHSSVPNGGLQAWLQVACGFMLFFNTWGLLNTFGIYQTYYESGQLFHESSSNISWIGALQAYFVLLTGFVSGPIYDRGYLRSLLLIGTFGVVFGHMMLSICHTYWQVVLAQGVCVGVGAGCLFVPGVAILPTYFSTKIGVAVGLAASGSSMGGIIYPIVFFRLIDRVGFGWTVRIIGFIALASLFVPIGLMKMRIKPPRIRDLFDISAFTDWPYMFFLLATFIGFIGLYVFLFYVSYFGQAHQITDASLTFYLVPILNAGSVLGRTLPNALSDKVGPFNLLGPGALVCGILNFCMIGVSNVGGIVVVTLLFGFFSGVFIALPAVCLFILTKDKSRIGTRVGMGFAIIGLATFAGGPGGGDILQNYGKNLNWRGLWIYGGVSNIVSGTLFVILRFWRASWKVKAKV